MVTVVAPAPVTNPVPAITTLAFPFPWRRDAGVTLVIFGPVFTVNVGEPVAAAPSPFVTDTVPAPVVAPEATLMFTVNVVALVRVVEFTVMPGFENVAASGAPATNPVPVIVTLPVKP